MNEPTQTSRNYTSDPRVDHVAKAIAWIELSPKGQTECKWPDEWSETEVARYRLMAIAAMEVLGV